MAQETGLSDVMDAIRWRWKLALLVAVGVVAGAAYYVDALPNQYSAQAIVALAPRTDQGAGADTVRLIAPTYVEYVVAPSTVRDVAAGLGIDPDKIADALDASVATDSGNLVITAETLSPSQAAEVANSFAREAVALSARDDLVQADLVVEAIPPDAPAGPPRLLLLVAASGVGLLLGVALSLLVERGRPRLRSSHDLARLTGQPVVGRIPRSRALKNRPLEAFSDPVVAAGFRTLRANLERQWQDRTVASVVVTSPGVGDGKSTVAALFAESLARLGAQVLLIDADLRRPRLADTMSIKPDGDLVAVLRHRTSLASAVHPGWTEGLHVLLGVPDPDAGDLIAMSFQQVIVEARQKFDVIVIDSPPVIGTDDARTLSTLVDGVLVVVSAGSDARETSEAMLALESLRAPLLGVVGNRLREAARTYAYA